MKLLSFLIVTFFLLVGSQRLYSQANNCAVTTFQKAFGRSDIYGWSMDVVETPDHGFISGGMGGDNNDCFLMKVDHSGNVVWCHQIKDTGSHRRGYMKRFIRLKNGNYLGLGRAFLPDFLDIWMIEFDENGAVTRG